ncbi:MAG: Na+/H+ antiporter NhaA [Gammaproteobacteria bacterium]|nr:Na+/H+ antiporter NhaA [Gammaproteobacteria bacterium]
MHNDNHKHNPRHNHNQSESEQTAIEQGLEKILSPFQQFIKNQTTSSLVLILATVAALVIANSGLASYYHAWQHLPLGIVVGDWSLVMGSKHWINDGLMTIFFFLLGLEIKREMLVGEIKQVQVLVPVMAAALGGMLVPAGIYYGFNAGTAYAQGWGIPMATDTAFAIGVLAFLGRRIPATAFTFLVALAIIDDLGAILVIALFYSDSINLLNLWVGAGLLLLLILLNVIGVRNPWVYLGVGTLLWGAMLGSGIHATVAGILIAATVPARPKRKPGWFLQRVTELVSKFERLERRKDGPGPMLAEAEQHAVVESMQAAAEKATTPLRRWERVLEYPVALLVLPIFAFANAGIELHLDALQESQINSVALGVVLGLVLGKGVGIPLFTWVALRLGLGQLPAGLQMSHVVGLGLLGGIGFTMSMFISSMGFEEMPAALNTAKLGILVASLLAGLAGYFWLRRCGQKLA